MPETSTQNKVEPIIKTYRELEESQINEARLELENAQGVETFVTPYMHSGTSGEVHYGTYNYNCATIIVSQNRIESIASWRKGENLKLGWQKRRFRIAGLEQNVGSIIKEIEEKGVKLREI